jgi:3-hydroxyisobutyrate dehydrogenase
MGSKVVHAGPLGRGTQFKLARNLLHFVFTLLTAVFIGLMRQEH